MRFITTEERKTTCRRENEVLIQRLKHDGVTVPYRVVENPLKFGDDEWSRVVAVFVQVLLWLHRFTLLIELKCRIFFLATFILFHFVSFIYFLEYSSTSLKLKIELVRSSG